MASQAQPVTPSLSRRKLAANQINARKSTGPRSIKGKQVSRLNARKHGLAQQQCSPNAPNEVAAAIAQELPTHAFHLAQDIATSFDTLDQVHKIRSDYIRKTNLTTASLDQLKKLSTKLARLERYERSAHSRLASALVELLVLRARSTKQTQVRW